MSDSIQDFPDEIQNEIEEARRGISDVMAIMREQASKIEGWEVTESGDLLTGGGMVEHTIDDQSEFLQRVADMTVLHDYDSPEEFVREYLEASKIDL